jgi:hypothetical protein
MPRDLRHPGPERYDRALGCWACRPGCCRPRRGTARMHEPGGGAHPSSQGRSRAPHLTFLAFDFGLKRTGVASRQPPAAHGQPRGTIQAEGDARCARSPAHQGMAARRPGGGRALPPRRRRATRTRARAQVRAPAARALRPAGVRGGRALQHHRGPAGRRRVTPTRRRLHHPGTVFEESAMTPTPAEGAAGHCPARGLCWTPRPCTASCCAACAPAAASTRLVGITSGGAWLAERLQATWAWTAAGRACRR